VAWQLYVIVGIPCHVQISCMHILIFYLLRPCTCHHLCSQSAGGALLADTIPATWSALWEGPASPADYIRAVVARGLAIEGWWGHTSAGTLLTSGGVALRGVGEEGGGRA
jgi:hypothetical protein